MTDALDVFAGELSSDPSVMGVIALNGSLLGDREGAGTGPDLVVVRKDPKARAPAEVPLSLVVAGRRVRTVVVTLTLFRQLRDSRSVQTLLRGTVLFARDDVVRDVFAGMSALRRTDSRALLLLAAARVAPVVARAREWLTGNGDPRYALHRLAACLPSLAEIECLVHLRIPDDGACNEWRASAEPLEDAWATNASFFDELHARLAADDPRGVAAHIERYLDDHRRDLFGPVIDYLSAEGAIRSCDEIARALHPDVGVESTGELCEWLVRAGVLGRTTLSRRLTEQSRIDVQQAAYFALDGAA